MSLPIRIDEGVGCPACQPGMRTICGRTHTTRVERAAFARASVGSTPASKECQHQIRLYCVPDPNFQNFCDLCIVCVPLSFVWYKMCVAKT